MADFILKEINTYELGPNPREVETGAGIREKTQWGKLTDSDLDQISGQRDMLVGKLQERYGIAREEAQKKAEEWLKTVKETDANQAAQEKHQTAKY